MLTAFLKGKFENLTRKIDFQQVNKRSLLYFIFTTKTDAQLTSLRMETWLDGASTKDLER